MSFIVAPGVVVVVVFVHRYPLEHFLSIPPINAYTV
jgi:hypothetical protein